MSFQDLVHYFHAGLAKVIKAWILFYYYSNKRQKAGAFVIARE